MKRVFAFVLSMLAAAAAHAQPLFSLPDSGSTTLGDWSFSWTLDGHHEGLVLTNVLWKGTKVLHKASLPVIKVKYRGRERDVRDGCGPYADRIGGVKTDHLAGVPDGVNVVARLWDGQLMELAVYDEIGGYDLYHAWYFHTAGWMEGLLYSRGWSCGHSPPERRDHRHHPYWRFDFDVESINNDVSTFRRSPAGSTTFFARTTEGQSNRFTSNLVFGARVTSNSSARHVNAQIPDNEMRDASGPPWFGYSNKDIGWRRWRSSEDDGWQWGSLGHLGLGSPAENIAQSDVVLWFVAHMSHNWNNGDDPAGEHWHGAGPTIVPSW